MNADQRRLNPGKFLERNCPRLIADIESATPGLVRARTRCVGCSTDIAVDGDPRLPWLCARCAPFEPVIARAYKRGLDFAKPDIERAVEHARLWQAACVCFGFGLLVTAFSFLFL